MLQQVHVVAAVLVASVCVGCDAFLASSPVLSGVISPSAVSSHAFHLTTPKARSERTYRRPLMSAAADIKDLCLTPELERLVKAFRSMPNDQMRYKQLLFMASQGEELESELKVQSNKVEGCLSTVHVVGESRDGLIYFRGDSDGQLTKGLVNLLLRGLSGNPAEAIQNVKPEFIRVTGLQASLTPGRNNGFINMLQMMKRKAMEISTGAEGGASTTSTGEEDSVEVAQFEEVEGKPMTAQIGRKLQELKPVEMEVEDEAGDESKFYIGIVSNAFEGLPLLKRHQMVYATIAEEMKIVHAVTLSTKTPAEVGL
ncbi:unnamed protein product [Choristocarpus tenellus]